MSEHELDLGRRIFILSKTYSLFNRFFVHWQDAPNIDVDEIFNEFLSRAIDTDDRKDFTFLMIEFFAKFNNIHSWYMDRWFYREFGRYQPFKFRPMENEWVITTSYQSNLSIGDVIKKINNENFHDFFTKNGKYLLGVNERQKKYYFAKLMSVPLFPLKYTLTLDNNDMVEIDRTKKPDLAPKEFDFAPKPIETEGEMIRPDLAYIKIPSFDNPKFQEKALTLLEEFSNVGKLIIDVRGNTGGSTPLKLTKKLMDRPYRSFSYSTIMNFGLLSYYNEHIRQQLKENLDANKDNPFLQMCKEFSIFDKPQLLWHSNYTYPTDSSYTGKLVILTDGFTGSAAEDFVMPFKDNKRATIIGETTNGSTGQPYNHKFDDEIWVCVGTKRAYFPDGSPFEGVGIKPDIEVIPTIKDIKNQKDIILEKTLSL